MKNRFVMQFRYVTPSGKDKWTWFDALEREYTLLKAIERLGGCSFVGHHEVRVACQDPHRHVYKGTPTTQELALWLAHFGNDEELVDDEQEGL